ncbi:MAG: DUF2807 domain-containing protein [Saprospiraceae bacterium]|nr:DUF2807 domain-containing protein [Saprospiraceae bacterium]
MKQVVWVLMLMIPILATSQEVRNPGNFVSVYTGGDVKVELIPAATAKIEFKMLKGSADDLITEVSGGTLKIKINQGMYGGKKAKADVKVYYTNALEGIEVAAGSTLTSKAPIKSRNLELSSSSGARMNIEVQADVVVMDGSSGSRSVVTGKIKDKVTVDGSSGANIDASLLEATRVEAEATSGANVKVWAVESLDAETSSGGKVSYKGDPKNKNVHASISGGNVSKL